MSGYLYPGAMSEAGGQERDLEHAIGAVAAAAEARRDAVERIAAERRVDGLLPLRFLRQQAHFTTPASDATIARKAVEGGFGATARILDRFDISAATLADALSVPESRVTGLLHRDPPAAPLVMVDSEDAAAPREDVVAQGRVQAAEVFRQAAWHPSTLRFYRPNGLDTGWTARDLAHVLLAAGPGNVDGIIYPKADHPEEMAWVDETLSAIERRQGVATGAIKVSFLVESGWGVRNLDRIALTVRHRLAGMILGIADYSSDVGLPEIRNDHPTADWVRREIVNVAGALGVPAIDTMTFGYPVADAALSSIENRGRILDRLKTVYRDALHGISLGMAGKWVGHPLQLFAVLLAFEGTLTAAEVEARVREVEAYTAAVALGRGAAIVDGMMVDRATDRLAREVLRKAVAWQRLDPTRALALGVIQPDEVLYDTSVLGSADPGAAKDWSATAGLPR